LGICRPLIRRHSTRPAPCQKASRCQPDKHERTEKSQHARHMPLQISQIPLLSKITFSTPDLGRHLTESPGLSESGKGTKGLQKP
jgi:hypothetical protein